MYLEICNVYFHASWPPTRRARPDRIPDARDLIEFPWSVLKLSVSLIMNPLANSLDSDQAGNFDKVSTFKLLEINELGPGPRHEIYFFKEVQYKSLR